MSTTTTATRPGPVTAHAGPVAAALRAEVWEAVCEEDGAGAREVLDYFLEEAAAESSISSASVFRRAQVLLRRDAGYVDRLVSALREEHGEPEPVADRGPSPASAAGPRRTRRGRPGRRAAAAEPLSGGNVVEVDFRARRRRRGPGGGTPSAASPASASR